MTRYFLGHLSYDPPTMAKKTSLNALIGAKAAPVDSRRWYPLSGVIRALAKEFSSRCRRRIEGHRASGPFSSWQSQRCVRDPDGGQEGKRFRRILLIHVKLAPLNIYI